MKSKAAIGTHPLHPALVVIPIGSLFAAFVGDLMYAATAQTFWYEFAYYTMMIGVIGALVAAVFGFIDFFGVRMSEAGYRVARTHMIINLAVVLAYGVNLWLRHDFNALQGTMWTVALWLEILSFAALAVSGWLGGKISYEHKVGVVENYDPEATEIGREEAVYPDRVPARTRNRGLQG